MNGVERVREYGNLTPEAPPTSPHDPPQEQWPSKGEIAFNNVELRFRPELPLVLKGLTFNVRSGEKVIRNGLRHKLTVQVGIVGRTGAGKSSLAQALFRSVELAGGTIAVDDLDLKKVGLDTVSAESSLCTADTVSCAVDWRSSHRTASYSPVQSVKTSTPKARCRMQSSTRLCVDRASYLARMRPET